MSEELNISPEFSFDPVSCTMYDEEDHVMDNINHIHCSIMNPIYIKYVSGPHYFSKLTFRGKNIFMFGENFGAIVCTENYYNTVIFSGLMESLLTYSPEISYKLFFEVVLYSDKGLTKYDSIKTINTFKTMFYDCITPNDEYTCPYKNISIENIHIRHQLMKISELNRLYNRLYYTDDINADTEKVFELTKTILLLDIIKKAYGSYIEEYNYVKDIIERYLSEFKSSNNKLFIREGNSMLTVMYTIGRILNLSNSSDNENFIFYGNSFNAINITKILSQFGAEIDIKIHQDIDDGCIKMDVQSIFKLNNK